MPEVRCPGCGTMVELFYIMPETLAGKCSTCGTLIMDDLDLVVRPRGERLRTAAHALGKVLFAASAIPLAVVWVIALFGWLGVWGVAIGVVAFPSCYLAPFVMWGVNGATTLTFVAVGLWVANVAGMALMRLSGRED